jgi:hypothetical protein
VPAYLARVPQDLDATHADRSTGSRGTVGRLAVLLAHSGSSFSVTAVNAIPSVHCHCATVIAPIIAPIEPLAVRRAVVGFLGRTY